MVGILVMVLIVTTFMHRSRPLPVEGHVAPDIHFASIDGQSTDLDGLHGHPVFLLFLAPDDGTSIRIARAMEAMYRKYGRQIAFIAIMTNGNGDGEASARILVHRYGIQYPVLFGDIGSVQKTYHLTLFPTAIWINAYGVIVKRIDNDFHQTNFTEQFASLISGGSAGTGQIVSN